MRRLRRGGRWLSGSLGRLMKPNDLLKYLLYKMKYAIIIMA